MITIRDSRTEDADALAAMNRAFNGVDRDPEQIRESLSYPSSQERVLVAEEAGTIVGFLCLQTLRSMCYDSPWVEITELYVTSTHRGRGVGRALVGEAETRAERAGATELVLRTNVRNAGARRLCQHIGLTTASHLVFRRVYSGAT